MYYYSTDPNNAKTNDLRVVFTTVPLKIGRICSYRYDKVLTNWITITDFKRTKDIALKFGFTPVLPFHITRFLGPNNLPTMYFRSFLIMDKK